MTMSDKIRFGTYCIRIFKGKPTRLVRHACDDCVHIFFNHHGIIFVAVMCQLDNVLCDMHSQFTHIFVVVSDDDVGVGVQK